MKIACIIHSLNGGGAERVMAGLVSRLSRRGHDVVLITLDDGSGDRYPVEGDVQRITLDVMSDSRNLVERLRSSRQRLRAIGRAIDDVSPDVVLSFCDRVNLLVVLALRGLSVALSSGRVTRRMYPLVISERTDPRQQSLGKIGEWFRRQLYPAADQVVALTERSASFLREIGCTRVDVIPSAVDPPPIVSARKAAIERRRFVSVGRLEHEKGFDRLLVAFANLGDAAADWELRIVGEGRQREGLLRLAKELSITDRVCFPGWVYPIWDELAAGTVFVLPSRYEGFPSALLEAMTVGVPCLSVDCESGPRAIIEHGENGLLVENTIEALAEGMTQMIADPELREHLGCSATAVVEQFGWEAMVDAYERVLKRTVESSAER